MEETLGLSAIALGFAAVATAVAARSLDAVAPRLGLWQKFVLVSAAPALAVALFELVVLGSLGGLGRILRSSYQRNDVFIQPMLYLWLSGLICALVMAFLRRRSRDRSTGLSSQLATIVLLGLFLITGTAVLLSIGMQSWIDDGHIGPVFILLILVCATGAGVVPVIGLAIGLFSRFGASGLRRAQLAAAVLAGIIFAGSLAWYSSVADRPGAWTIVPVSASTLFGILVAFALIRRWLGTRVEPGSD